MLTILTSCFIKMVSGLVHLATLLLNSYYWPYAES